MSAWQLAIKPLTYDAIKPPMDGTVVKKFSTAVVQTGKSKFQTSRLHVLPRFSGFPPQSEETDVRLISDSQLGEVANVSVVDCWPVMFVHCLLSLLWHWTGQTFEKLYGLKFWNVFFTKFAIDLLISEHNLRFLLELANRSKTWWVLTILSWVLCAALLKSCLHSLKPPQLGL